MKRVVQDGVGFIVPDNKVAKFVSQGYKVEKISTDNEVAEVKTIEPKKENKKPTVTKAKAKGKANAKAKAKAKDKVE